MTIVNSGLKGVICWFGVCFDLNGSNFYPLEVVGRGSETQLQVGTNLNSNLNPFSAGIVFIRQNPTSKDDRRVERIKTTFIMAVDP